MRFLNKITFINSATIRYAEVGIDGNVHFIGTQGVGKSTVLRAILFFYNADTLKLGISREKKSFAEYYFPYQNSYLIYEVTIETGNYSILAFKSQGKVCFRFIDTGYRQELYIAPGGKAHETWEATRTLLDKDKIYYSKKIDRYDEYRDILYGNNEAKKEFRKYALLESRQYQNIPRTIQNVFLNSKLEAEFIKQTIIMSLNEVDVQIDLQSYTHHFKDFEDQLKDINLFRQPHILKQTENVLKYNTAVKQLEKEHAMLAKLLAYSISHTQRKEPRLKERLEKEQAGSLVIKQRIDESEKRFYNKMDRMRAEISVLEDKLKTIKEKKDYYEKLDITNLLQLVGRRGDLEARQDKLRKEKEVLSQEYKEVTQKYLLLQQTLENSYKDYTQGKEKQKLELYATLLDYKQDAKKKLDKLVAEIKDNAANALHQARTELEQRQAGIHALKVKKEAARHQRYFEDEIAEATKQVYDLQLAIQHSRNEITALKGRQELAQKQWELEETTIKRTAEREAEKTGSNIDAAQLAIAGIDARLSSSKDSFYGWLNENFEGWENTIGKVCDEDVLYSSSLSPQLLPQGGEAGLYGVAINHNAISRTIKTAADYEQEHQLLTAKVAAWQKQMETLEQQKTEELEKLKKRYQPKIKEAKDLLGEQEYIATQSSQKLEQARLEKKDHELNAEAKRKDALQQIEVLLDAATQAHTQAREALAAIDEALQKQVAAKDKEHERRTATEEDNYNTWVKQSTREIKTYKEGYDKERQELNKAQKRDLDGKGADTHKLDTIEQNLEAIAEELRVIEETRDIVTEYRKDKRELLDKGDSFKNDKQVLEQKAENDRQKQRQHIQVFRNEIKAIDETIDTLKDELRKAHEDMEEYADFQLGESYASIPASYREPKDEHKNDRRAKALIAELKACYYNSIRRIDDLKEAVNKFLGNFSARNLFNFATTLVARQQYLDFAEQLNDFVADNKIEEFEKRINERFSTIIHSLGKETTNLMSKGDEIQRIITSINKDFERKNFVGAIKKIELRLDESANKVVHLLLQVKKFNDEHAYDIGGLNLFSSNDSEAKNKKAVDLLKQLSKNISEHKKEYISLSDSFELKFRVEENRNDTGWVEKLANVGSEGTDVLVKAMINIMLLNVFKEGASKRFKEFRLHCMMDEIGKLHPNNVKGILQFANDRNILLINGSPTETNAMDYRHIYKLEKDAESYTKVKRIISNYA